MNTFSLKLACHISFQVTLASNILSEGWGALKGVHFFTKFR